MLDMSPPSSAVTQDRLTGMNDSGMTDSGMTDSGMTESGRSQNIYMALAMSSSLLHPATDKREGSRLQVLDNTVFLHHPLNRPPLARILSTRSFYNSIIIYSPRHSSEIPSTMYHLKPLALALTLIGILPGLSSAANIRRDVPSGFNLYAYGDGIGGYPVVYLNGTMPMS